MAEEVVAATVSAVVSDDLGAEEFAGLVAPVPVVWPRRAGAAGETPAGRRTAGQPVIRAARAGLARSRPCREVVPAPRSAPDPGQDETVRSLVRALVRRVTELSGGRLPADGPLVDCREAGVRCVLERAQPGPEGLAALLSPREREIARMVGLGYTNKAIADVLDISLYTVSTHLRRIFAKLDVPSRAAMVAVLSGASPLLGTQVEQARDRRARR
jgi:DNA-binding CsgD family transcriptional regulator